MNEYKVYIDISDIAEKIKDLGLGEYKKKVLSVTVEAKDPDEVCSILPEMLYKSVKGKRRATRYVEAAELVRDNHKIKKIKFIRKYE